MRFLAKRGRFTKTIACGVASMLGMVGMRQLEAQNVKTKYPGMVPIEEYLMERNAEIALARSAAPEAISRDATVLILGRNGYETAVQGKNGFVCMVERGWVGILDWTELWNPKIRGADCLNPPAAQSILPLAEIRTEMVLAGHTRTEIVDRIKAALSKKEVPALESGAMGYMMSKDSYLTDEDGHNGPHLMFFMPLADAAVWGAGMPGSPVGSVPYWFFSEKTSQEFNGLPPIRVSPSRWASGQTERTHPPSTIRSAACEASTLDGSSVDCDELADFEAHLRDCQECRLLLTDYRELVTKAIPLLTDESESSELSGFNRELKAAKKNLFARLEQGSDVRGLGQADLRRPIFAFPVFPAVLAVVFSICLGAVGNWLGDSHRRGVIGAVSRTDEV